MFPLRNVSGSILRLAPRVFGRNSRATHATSWPPARRSAPLALPQRPIAAGPTMASGASTLEFVSVCRAIEADRRSAWRAHLDRAYGQARTVRPKSLKTLETSCPRAAVLTASWSRCAELITKLKGGNGRGSRVGTPHSDMIWCTSITLPSGSWKKIWCHPFIAHVP